MLDLLKENESYATRKGLCDSSTLKNSKFIGLYFAEYFCPLSRYLTPLLIETYQHLNSKFANNLEIVLISNDLDNDEYEKSLQDMPWIALPFSMDQLKDDLIMQYNVIGMPRLIILSNSGRIISSMEQNEIEENIYDPFKIFYRWERIDSYAVDKEYLSKNHSHKQKFVDNTEMEEFECYVCSSPFPEFQPRLTCEDCEILTCCQCFIEDEVRQE